MKSIDSTKRDYQRTKIMSEFREQENLNLRVKIPKAQYELWQGIKAAHGLNEDFLEFVVSRMVSQTIFTFLQMTEAFAE